MGATAYLNTNNKQCITCHIYIYPPHTPRHNVIINYITQEICGPELRVGLPWISWNHAVHAHTQFVR